ncbi:MAG: hypothetical protein ABI742_04355 [Gemmatimonadota bacterium]
MTLREVRLSLSGFGAAPSVASLEIRTLTPGERLQRAAMAPAIGLGIAVLVLPIPIVHFAVPPVALIGGVVMGFRRASQGELIATAHGACPFCGTEQTLGVNGTAYRLPRSLKCRNCLRPMTLDVA